MDVHLLERKHSPLMNFAQLLLYTFNFNFSSEILSENSVMLSEKINTTTTTTIYYYFDTELTVVLPSNSEN